ncbi:MAG: OmpA family protein [Spirochaetota bacterium]
MKRSILMIILFGIACSAAFGYKLRWDVPAGKRLEVVKTADVEVFINSKFKERYEERNIIDLTCYARTPEGGKFKGAFSVFRRKEKQSVFTLDARYFSDFLISPTGQFTVPKEYVMPNVRDVPAFPDEDVTVGSSWTEAAQDILLEPYLAMNVSVDYFFSATERENGTNVGTIDYRYTIDKDLTQKRFPANYPAKIYGFDYTTLRWDLDRNLPMESDESYRIMFVMGDLRSGYQSMEYKMNIRSFYRVYDRFDGAAQEEEKRAIEKNIPRDSGVTVATNERGIVLRLGELLFDTDSYRLRPDASRALDAIQNVLKERYPDREIIVEGHTDNTGSSQYNRTLSENRAQTVAEAIKKALNTDKLSFRGYGKDAPIAENSTPDGRQKNRRVDVIIKLN